MSIVQPLLIHTTPNKELWFDRYNDIIIGMSYTLGYNTDRQPIKITHIGGAHFTILSAINGYEVKVGKKKNAHRAFIFVNNRNNTIDISNAGHPHQVIPFKPDTVTEDFALELLNNLCKEIIDDYS